MTAQEIIALCSLLYAGLTVIINSRRGLKQDTTGKAKAFTCSEVKPGSLKDEVSAMSRKLESSVVGLNTCERGIALLKQRVDSLERTEEPFDKGRGMNLNVNWKDIWIRAGKTFLQAFISCLVASLNGVNFMVLDQNANWWMSALLSAGAAGLSFAWNGVLKPLWEKYATPPADEPKE